MLAIITVLNGLPTWLKGAILGAALFFALEVKHTLQVRGLTHQIGSLTHELDHERAVEADERAAVAELTANRDKIQAQVVAQNQAITTLRDLAVQKNAQATVKALRVLQTKTPANAAGYLELNRWLAQRVSPSRSH